MATVIPIQTYENKLDGIEIQDGQLIVCVDTGSLYKDTSNKRIKLGSELKIVESLPEIPEINKFYFVSTTDELWIYNEEWVQINSSLVAQQNSDGWVNLAIGKQNLESGIKIKGSGATHVTTSGNGTISIETDPNTTINVISNFEIDNILSM